MNYVKKIDLKEIDQLIEKEWIESRPTGNEIHKVASIINKDKKQFIIEMKNVIGELGMYAFCVAGELFHPKAIIVGEDLLFYLWLYHCLNLRRTLLVDEVKFVGNPIFVHTNDRENVYFVFEKEQFHPYYRRTKEIGEPEEEEQENP